MIGFNGGLIGRDRTTTVGPSLSGVWTAREQAKARRNGVWPSSDVDSDYASVSLLLHGSGSNNSTTFTDNSPSPKTVYFLGDAKISTAQYKFGSSSIAFDGAGSPNDRLFIPAGTADLQFGSGDFCIECWVYRLNTNTACIIIGQADLATVGGSSWLFAVGSTGTSDVYIGGTAYTVASPNPSINTWAHVALTRSGSTLRSFLNGAIVATNASLGAGAVNNGATTFPNTIGAFDNNTTALNGYIGELRITKGVPRYTAAFTPTTAPFPNQ